MRDIGNAAVRLTKLTMAKLQFRAMASAAQAANERSRGLPLAAEVLRWLVTGKGILTYSPSIVAASVKVLEESATPDMQVTFAPGSFKGGQIGELEEKPGLSAGAWQMRTLSRGYVEPKSNRPGEAPAANPRYLSEEK
jgi:choline dehydrogenase